MPFSIIGGPDSGVNPDDVRPQLTIGNAAEAYEWLRVAVGTGRLDDLRYSGGCLRSHNGDSRLLTAATFAALIQARHAVFKRNGTPALFPTSACRLVLNNLPACPNLIDRHTGVVVVDYGRASA
jgi:hypothetical protein